jgi:outer membrane protein assembly factor BamB
MNAFVNTRMLKRTALLAFASLSVACLGFGATSISLSLPKGPPSTTVFVSGAGFPAGNAVDIYFDSADLALVVSDGSGDFSRVAIHVPSYALPGNHLVSAVARVSGTAAQKLFLVRTDWPQYGFSPTGARNNIYENVLGIANVNKIGLHWKAPTAGASSAPVVYDGRLYFGSGDHNLHAINAITGAELWTFATGDNLGDSPAAAGGLVYIGSLDNVYALNARTGDLIWTFDVGLGGVESAPAVVNGILYLGVNGEGDSDGGLLALDGATGAQLWKFETGIAATSPAVANGIAYVGSGNSTLDALDAVTGAKLWEFDANLGTGAPSVANGRVFFSSDDGTFYGLNAITGAQIWSFFTGVEFGGSPAIAGDKVYVGSSNGSLYSFNSLTGTLIWTFATSSGIQSSPAVADGVIYVTSTDSTVYALNANTGAFLWSYTTGGSLRSSPTVANGIVYVGSDDGNLYAFDLKGGLMSRSKR